MSSEYWPVDYPKVIKYFDETFVRADISFFPYNINTKSIVFPTESCAFVIKFINYDDKVDFDNIRREIDTMSRIKHHNSLGIHCIVQFEELQLFALVLENISDGDIYTYIKKGNKVSYEQMVRSLYNLVDALAEMHSKNIIHNDLKPENILYMHERDILRLVVCDFGLADILEEGKKLKCQKGSFMYWAPEIIKKTGYTFSADVWAFGVIVYMIFLEEPPFRANADIYENFTNNRYGEFKGNAYYLVNYSLMYARQLEEGTRDGFAYDKILDEKNEVEKELSTYKRSLNDDGKELLDICLKSGKRISETIGSILYLEDVKRGRIRPYCKEIPDELAELIESCLSMDPEERPTFEEIKSYPIFEDCIPANKTEIENSIEEVARFDYTN